MSKQSPQPENSYIKLTSNVSGNTSGLQYKFVWMTDNWKKWGVIKHFSAANNASWKPTEPGNYTLFLDIEGKGGRIDTKTQDVHSLRSSGIFL